MEIVPVTILREAEDQGPQGQLGVYCVIRNRAQNKLKKWPNDEEEVCLQPFQFSCWNSLDKTRTKYYGPLQIKGIQNLISGLGDKDITNGATYYCNPKICKNPFIDESKYIETARIGDHIFYKEGTK